MSPDSVPRHWTSPNQIGPLPSGTSFPVRATAPLIVIIIMKSVKMEVLCELKWGGGIGLILGSKRSHAAHSSD